MTSVLTAVAALYDAFQSRPPLEVEGCPCCSDPEELQALVNTPRDALTAAQLEFYASSALLTVGGVDDLRHYWPRLVELSLTGELQTDPEIVFAKPRHGEWRNWPAAEQEALVALAHAQVDALAQGGDAIDDFAVETWVCAFGQFLADVTVVLSPLLRPEPGPMAALRKWYALNEDDLARDMLWDTFWEFAPGNAARVCAWFAEPSVRDAVNRALTSTLSGGEYR